MRFTTPISTNQSGATGQATGGSTGGMSDVTMVAGILEKQYQDSHYLKEEYIGKWDDKTKTGIPQEVITRYNHMKDPDFIMMLTEMKKFKNPLMLSKNGN